MGRKKYDIQQELFDYLNTDLDPYDFAPSYLGEWAAEMGIDGVDSESEIDSLSPGQVASFVQWLRATHKPEEWVTQDPYGSPAYLTMTMPRKMPKGSWLIHFTKASPFNVFNQGTTLEGLHLSTYRKEKVPVNNRKKNLSEDIGSFERVYGFAYDAKTRDVVRHGSLGYGKNAVLFQSDFAVKAYHSGDEEDQVVFPIGSEYNAIPLFVDVGDFETSDDGELIGKTESGEEVSFRSLDEVIKHATGKLAYARNPSDPLIRIR